VKVQKCDHVTEF